MIGIYKIISPKNKIYIGQSVNVEKRFRSYKRGYGAKLQRKLYNSFDKYGVDKHIFTIICECDKSSLNELEIFYSILYNSTGPNGLNIRECGGCKGGLSQETKDRISSANKGRSHSKETREKIRKTLLGNIPWNKGTKGVMHAWNKGIPHSEATKLKLRNLYVGKTGKDCLSAKTILQKNLNGDILREWHGALEVERELGFRCSSVNRCARGERDTGFGFIWKYK